MPTPLEVLDGATWLCGIYPRATDVYYTREGWRLKAGDSYATTYLLDCVLRRDKDATLELLACGGITRLSDDVVREGWVPLSRAFLIHGRRDRWMDGAAWTVLQAAEIEYVAPNTSTVFMDHMWWCRGIFGECMLSSPIENRYSAGFQASLAIIKSQPMANYQAITSWIARDFLEAWPHTNIPTTTAVPVVSAPAVDVKVNLSVTTEEQLPPDLRGKVQLKGLSAQERRQAHTQALLQDMLTKTAPPRYK